MNDDIKSEFFLGPKFFPAIPRPAQMWRSISFWVSVAYIVIILRAVPQIIVNYWFLKHLGQPNVFWTNFIAQLLIFSACITLFLLAVYIPIRKFSISPTFRKAGIHIGIWIGIFVGWLLSLSYQRYLLALHAVPFGEQDPVFGKDIGFYVFILPAIQITLTFITVLAIAGAASALIARFHQLRSRGDFQGLKIPFLQKLGMLITNP